MNNLQMENKQKFVPHFGISMDLTELTGEQATISAAADDDIITDKTCLTQTKQQCAFLSPVR